MCIKDEGVRLAQLVTWEMDGSLARRVFNEAEDAADEISKEADVPTNGPAFARAIVARVEFWVLSETRISVGEMLELLSEPGL